MNIVRPYQDCELNCIEYTNKLDWKIAEGAVRYRGSSLLEFEGEEHATS